MVLVNSGKWIHRALWESWKSKHHNKWFEMPIQIEDPTPRSLMPFHMHETRARTKQCVGMRGNGPGDSKLRNGPLSLLLCWLPIRNTICNSFSMMWSPCWSWASFGVVRNFTKEHLPRIGVSWIASVLVIFFMSSGDFTQHLNTFPKILRPAKNCFPHSSDSCSFCRGLFPLPMHSSLVSSRLVFTCSWNFPRLLASVVFQVLRPDYLGSLRARVCVLRFCLCLYSPPCLRCVSLAGVRSRPLCRSSAQEMHFEPGRL